MSVPATRLRRGMAIKSKSDSGILTEVEHRTPGKGAGFVQVIMRSFNSGKTKDLRFAASDKVEIIKTNREKLEYSYSDGNTYFFMDPITYEMREIDSSLLEESKDILIENLMCEVLFVEGEAISVELPPTVELKVTDAPEGLKGDTANNPTKSITLETGKIIQAPLFIKKGDNIKLDTKTHKYQSRN